MNFFGQDVNFWIAAGCATMIKLFSSPYHSFLRAVLTVFAAIFSAYFFTEPALDYLRLNPEIYRAPVAAIVALTGEGVMRALIEASLNPQKWLADVVSKWRAK